MIFNPEQHKLVIDHMREMRDFYARNIVGCEKSKASSLKSIEEQEKILIQRRLELAKYDDTIENSKKKIAEYDDVIAAMEAD